MTTFGPMPFAKEPLLAKEIKTTHYYSGKRTGKKIRLLEDDLNGKRKSLLDGFP